MTTAEQLFRKFEQSDRHAFDDYDSKEPVGYSDLLDDAHRLGQFLTMLKVTYFLFPDGSIIEITREYRTGVWYPSAKGYWEYMYDYVTHLSVITIQNTWNY